MSKTLFITGASSGFGHALAKEALAAGHRVIGTVRNQADLQALQSLSAENAYGVMLDVTDFERIDSVVAEVEATHGPVDVLVNNAGYGHEGIFEESPLEEMRRQFDVNVFGAVAVTKAFLPFFRQRRAGHILNITSMGGTITMPGIAYYCGSKFALEGISDTLSKELRPLISSSPPWHRVRFVPTGPVARCSAPRAALPITTPVSIRSAKPAKRRAASSSVIRKRLRGRCCRSSPARRLQPICCSAAMLCSGSVKGCNAHSPRLISGKR